MLGDIFEREASLLGQRPGEVVESVKDTLKGQLDLEHHSGRTWGGVVTWVVQRLLALTAAIWHNG